VFRATFLEVGHGDSIVLEIADGGRSIVVIVDCNMSSKGGRRVNRTLEFLQAKGVTTIDAAIVTHLHADHYSGFKGLVENFNIERLIIPPIVSQNERVFLAAKESIKETLRRELKRSNDPAIVEPGLALASLVGFIVQNKDRVEECTGKNSEFRIGGFDALVLKAYLPLRGLKGLLHHLLAGDTNYELLPDMNDSSIAIAVEYRQHKLLLA
jgi:glyoxylase-like metal-dependent hydrolase (beta-lactamase superfamily II)